MKRDAWVVVAEWPNDEPCTLAVFVGKQAQEKAKRYAEEMRYEYATGKYVPGKKYIVYGYGEDVEEYEENWEVSINVDRVDDLDVLTRKAVAVLL